MIGDGRRWRETVKRVVVHIAPVVGPGLKPTAVHALHHAMVERDEEGFQLVGLVAVVGRGVEVLQTEKLFLPAREEIGLRVVALKLETQIVTLEFVIVVIQRTVALRPRGRGIDGERASAEFHVAHVAAVKVSVEQAVVARADRREAARLHPLPSVGDAARSGVPARDGVVRARAHLRCAEQRGSHRLFGEKIMSRLRIIDRHGADAESGVFEGAAANRHIRLRLARAARLHVHERLITQRRHRHRKGIRGLLIGYARRIHHQFGQGQLFGVRGRRERISRGGGGSGHGWQHCQQCPKSQSRGSARSVSAMARASRPL